VLRILVIVISTTAAICIHVLYAARRENPDLYTFYYANNVMTFSETVNVLGPLVWSDLGVVYLEEVRKEATRWM